MKRHIYFLFLMAAVSGQGWALSLTPSIQSFDLEPGQKITGELTITNTEGEELTVTPATKNWFVLPENKSVKVDTWLRIDSKPFQLQSGETKKLQFNVSIPKKAVGELVGMLSFRTKSKTRSGLEFVLSGAIYAAVKGTEKAKGEVVAITVTPSSDVVHVGVLLKNEGNVHLRPEGMFQLINDEGQAVANVELEKGQPTYPGNSRSYMGQVKDLRLKPGKYKAKYILVDTDRGFQIDAKTKNINVVDQTPKEEKEKKPK